MPTIPQYERRVSARPTELSEIPVSAGSSVSEALSRVGEVMAQEGFEFDRAARESQKVIQVGEANVAASERLYGLSSSLLNSPEFHQNPETVPEQFKAGAKQVADELGQAITDPRARAIFQSHVKQEALSQYVEISSAARKKRIDISTGALLAQLQKWENLAGQAPNDQAQAEAIKQGKMAILGAVSAGMVPYEAGVKLEQKFQSGVAKTTVRRDIRINASETKNRLLAGDYPWLDEPDRETLIERAQQETDTLMRRQEADAARAETRYDRQLREARDQNEAAAWSMLDKGELNENVLEDLRRNRAVDANGYKALRRAVREEEGINNPAIETALLDQVYDPSIDKDALRSEVLRMAGKSIRSKTANELLGRIHQAKREDDISRTPVYQSAKDFVKAQLTTTGPLESLNMDDESRKAFALREFDDRVRKSEDPWVVADDVVRRGRKSETAPAGGFLRPRFLEGPANQTPALDQAEQKTVEAFRAGTIDVATYQREIEAIKGYRDLAIKAQEAATTVPKKEGKFDRR